MGHGASFYRHPPPLLTCDLIVQGPLWSEPHIPATDIWWQKRVTWSPDDSPTTDTDI